MAGGGLSHGCFLTAATGPGHQGWFAERWLSPAVWESKMTSVKNKLVDEVLPAPLGQNGRQEHTKGDLLSGHGGGSLAVLWLHWRKGLPSACPGPAERRQEPWQAHSHASSTAHGYSSPHASKTRCLSWYVLARVLHLLAWVAACGLWFTWSKWLEAATMFMLTAFFSPRYQAAGKHEAPKSLVSVPCPTDSLWPVSIGKWGRARSNLGHTRC